MVSQATDYEYVFASANGVLQELSAFAPRMKFDGNIMPFRSDNVVRGEDIAFLMEFAVQRYAAIESVYSQKKTGWSGGSTLVPDDRKGYLKEHLYAENLYVYAIGRCLTGCFAEAVNCALYFSSIPESSIVSSTSVIEEVFSGNSVSIPTTFYSFDDFYTRTSSSSYVRNKYPPLKRDRIYEYFDFCTKINNGVCKYNSYKLLYADVSFNEVGGSSPALNQIVVVSPTSLFGQFTQFGFRKADYSYVFGDLKGEVYNVFPSGSAIYSFYAPHVKEAYALCRLEITPPTGSRSYWWRFLKMTGRESTFTLYSDYFSTQQAILDIASQAGIDTSQKNVAMTITSFTAYPVITKFDDHTDFLSRL